MNRTALAIAGAFLFSQLTTNHAWAELLTVDTAPSGLIITVDSENYTTPALFDWEVGSLHALDVPTPQVTGEGDDGHSRFSFSSWSDGLAQSHSIMVSPTNATITASFITQYLLDAAVTPSGAGTITTAPIGPWYGAGQLVTLTVRPNSGYRLSSWQGADQATGNVARVTMTDYHAVQANLVPADFPYLVVTQNGETAPGEFIGNIDGGTNDSTRPYYVVLDNSATRPLFASATNVLHRNVTPQGFDAVATTAAFTLKDETFGVVESLQPLGYNLDQHDMKLLPNGHALLFGTEVRTIDMSALVPGGQPAA